ncbi:hypothetical protein [Chryseobacterium sp. JV274]|uniref:hypothetical protein n=1 Tax=Chryseobacterium sp. JV274 TaxID=1932669 RepID=UPI0015C254AF|nr:hypothetical protein [Chryseobacterium sp. JV274]CAD0221312.1 membrane protein of unknown function [Chryseobacterium sp. JV274]
MNKGLEIFDKLRENLIFIFSLSLISSYCASLGYYSVYNIDITSFLNISDITMIFAKWTWFTIFLIMMTFLILFDFFDEESDHKWLSKTIGKTNLKWRGLIIFIFIIIVLLSTFFIDHTMKKEIKLILFYGLIIFLIFIFIYIPSHSIKNRTISQLRFKDYAGAGFVFAFFVYALPLMIGYHMANYRKNTKEKNNIKITFENKAILDTTKDTNKYFIGKTSDYIFFYDINKQASIIYKTDKIEIIEYYSTKSKNDNWYDFLTN